MNSFYLYDGQNEAGPFTLDELKKQKLTRITPIRQKDSDKWMPAEKLVALKPLVVPRKIKRPKDVLPAVAENFSVLRRERPKTLYGVLFVIAMFIGLSFYSIGKLLPKPSSPDAKIQASSTPSSTGIVKAKAKESGANLTVGKAHKEAQKDDAAKATRLQWNKLISTTHSNYGIGFLGGIKDLSVIVTNGTDYPLDEVVMKVTYIKATGSVWKTVPLTIYNVPPHESKERPAPDVSRGKKVKVSLEKVLSKKMNFSYTEGQKGKDASDPYFKEP